MSFTAIAQRLLKVRARRGGGLSSYFGGDMTAVESLAADVMRVAGVTGRAGQMAAIEAAYDVLTASGLLGAGSGIDPYADPSTGYLPGDLVIDSVNGTAGGDGTLSSPKNALTGAILDQVVASSNRRIWLRGHMGQVYTPMADSYNNMRNKHGSSSNRIVMSGYPGDALPIWTNTDTTGKCEFQSNYWDFRRLNIQSRGNGFDGFFLGENSAATNLRWIDCTGANTPKPGVTQDNAGIVQLVNGNADYIELIRCNFVSNQNAGAGGNGGQAAVIAFQTRHLKVIGSKFTGNNGGFYFKHDHSAATASLTDIEFRNNVHYTPGQAVNLNCSFARFINELIIDCSGGADDGLWFYDQSGRAGGLQNYVEHCTLVGTGINLGAGSPGANDRLPYDVSVRNSIILDRGSRTGRRIQAPRYSTTDLRIATDYNLYQNDLLIRNASTTIAQRQSGGNDANSAKGVPTFAGSNAGVPSDWALVTGSLGKNAASDGRDIGCDVTKLLTVN